jgi:hypothetical protein
MRSTHAVNDTRGHLTDVRSAHFEQTRVLLSASTAVRTLNDQLSEAEYARRLEARRAPKQP